MRRFQYFFWNQSQGTKCFMEAGLQKWRGRSKGPSHETCVVCVLLDVSIVIGESCWNRLLAWTHLPGQIKKPTLPSRHPSKTNQTAFHDSQNSVSSGRHIQTCLNVTGNTAQAPIEIQNLINVFKSASHPTFHGKAPSLTHSFSLFSVRFRYVCNKIITHKMFDHIVLVIIFLNCITIAMERPRIDPSSAVSLGSQFYFYFLCDDVTNGAYTSLILFCGCWRLQPASVLVFILTLVMSCQASVAAGGLNHTTKSAVSVDQNSFYKFGFGGKNCSCIAE